MPNQTRSAPRKDEPLVQRVFYRWGTAEVLLLLSSKEEMRFSEICRELPTLSEQIICARLADLREVGMLRREVQADAPVAVFYSLTALGGRLAEAAATIKEISSSDALPAVAA